MASSAWLCAAMVLALASCAAAAYDSGFRSRLGRTLFGEQPEFRPRNVFTSQVGGVYVPPPDIKCSTDGRLLCVVDLEMQVAASPELTLETITNTAFMGILRDVEFVSDLRVTQLETGLWEEEREITGIVTLMGVSHSAYTRLLHRKDARNPDELVVTCRLLDSDRFEEFGGWWKLYRVAGQANITRVVMYHKVASFPLSAGQMVRHAALLATRWVGARASGRVASTNPVEQDTQSFLQNFVNTFGSVIVEAKKEAGSSRRERVNRVCKRKREERIRRRREQRRNQNSQQAVSTRGADADGWSDSSSSSGARATKQPFWQFWGRRH